MDQTIKKTEQTFGGMEKRIFCRKFMLWLGIILLTLANIVLLFLILAKGFGWPPFGDDKGNNGLDLKQDENIDFEDAYKKRNYSMIMIQAGNGIKPYDRLIDVIKALKDKSLGAGIYWIIENDTLTEALKEAEKAVEKAKAAKEVGGNGRSNRGLALEKLITEYFGQEWKADSKCFTECGDININGVEYQIKGHKATFTNEEKLRELVK
jgi:hypothetical protein